MLSTHLGDLCVTIFRNQFTRLGPLRPEQCAFLALYERFLDADPPDAVLTYGGDPLAAAMRELTRRRKIPVVFALHNFAYHDPRAFAQVDYVVVPSQFSKDFYRRRLGLECHVLPNVIDPQRVLAADGGGWSPGFSRPENEKPPEGGTPTDREMSESARLREGTLLSRSERRLSCGAKGDNGRPKYLTIVNPQATKGLFVLARIVHEIAGRRPDIPILIVDSRGRGKALEETGLDLSWAKNLFTMANTTDPRKFYRVSKAVLMPPLCNESFGLVAAEAMANGIPVLASNRGALTEVVGDGGLLFDIPARYTSETRERASAEEVAPWVEAILRLWDDEAFYRQQSEKAIARAAQWCPERLRPLYVEFFRNVYPQPGPPVAPKRTRMWDGLPIRPTMGHHLRAA